MFTANMVGKFCVIRSSDKIEHANWLQMSQSLSKTHVGSRRPYRISKCGYGVLCTGLGEDFGYGIQPTLSGYSTYEWTSPAYIAGLEISTSEQYGKYQVSFCIRILSKE